MSEKSGSATSVAREGDGLGVWKTTMLMHPENAQNAHHLVMKPKFGVSEACLALFSACAPDLGITVTDTSQDGAAVVGGLLGVLLALRLS